MLFRCKLVRNEHNKNTIIIKNKKTKQNKTKKKTENESCQTVEQMLLGKECLTSPKNACVGGYKKIRLRSALFESN